MRALFVHAHYDDYEFAAAGTFERWRQQLGARFHGQVLVCTDGRAGHHARTRAETGRLRLAEQRASARLGQYEFRLLRLPDGRVPREGCVVPDAPFLAALWRAIRAFEPDYLFCPPLPSDPRTGVHPDHLGVADAVRRVAYMINVPHAYTPEYPADEGESRPCRVPVILTVYDAYMYGAGAYDLGVDIEAAFPLVARLAWCHQTQIREWLPWVGRHRMEPPASLSAWETALRERFLRRQREMGLRRRRLVEVFSVTAWGEVPTLDQLRRDFPRPMFCARARTLERRLEQWRGGPS